MSDNFGAPADPDNIKQDEKLMSLFSHLSLFFGGILLPIIFWAVNKDKSKFTAFHALQSLWFHIAYAVLIVVILLIVLAGGMGLGFLSAGTGSDTMPVVAIIAIIAFYGLLFLFILGGLAYSIYMGIKAYDGKLVKYPIIGNLVYKSVYGNAV